MNNEKNSNASKKFITDSPKVNFFFGLILGVAIIAVIGFGIVLVGKDNGSNVNNKPTVAGEDQEPVVVDLQINNDDHVLGDKNAPVKIFTFSDFQCPYCSRHHETLHQIADEYDGQVVWIFKHFPLASHPIAMPGSLATECAGEQGKFWEMSDKIFENQQTLTEDSFADFASELGLDTGQFNSCFENETYKDKILADYNQGIDAGVRGTPSNFINGEMIPGAVPFENLKEIIDNLLE